MWRGLVDIGVLTIPLSPPGLGKASGSLRTTWAIRACCAIVMR
jgi:hypothetical protein